MTRRTIYSLLILLLFFSCSKESGKPNVLLILTDDQGYGDIGFNGNEYIETPTLDSLSENCFKFENFYVSAVCAPTRASLLTGKYAYRTGTHNVSNGMENMNPAEYTLAEVFADNGYKTAAFGKWHNGVHYPFHPNQQGFNKFVGFCMGHWNNYFNSTIEEDGKPVLAEGFIIDYLTNRAVEFIEANKNEPFFCYVPYNTPHSPFQVPGVYFDKYKKLGLDDKAACVYGMCENIDDNVDKLLLTLHRNNLSENTIVIYMSDNGPVPGRYNANLHGNKGQIYEGGVKVPSLMYIPQHLLNGESNVKSIDGITAHIDIMPTLVDLLNLEMKQEVDFDGISMTNTLRGEEDETFNNRKFFNKLHQKDPDVSGGALREGDYRLYIMRNRDTLLFNLAEDPYEQNDLKLIEPKRTAVMAQTYYTWINSVLAEMPSFTAVPVGCEGQNLIQMPAHEAVKTDGISWEEGHGWANDWLKNFTSSNDSVYWEIDVKHDGEYEVIIDYTASEKCIGTNLRMLTSSTSVLVPIQKAFTPSTISSPDKFPRKEAYEQTWGQINGGKITLTETDKYIALKLTENIKTDLEIKTLILKKL